MLAYKLSLGNYVSLSSYIYIYIYFNFCKSNYKNNYKTILPKILQIQLNVST